jgi:hypothetical protein
MGGDAKTFFLRQTFTPTRFLGGDNDDVYKPSGIDRESFVRVALVPEVLRESRGLSRVCSMAHRQSWSIIETKEIKPHGVAQICATKPYFVS